MSLSGLYKAGKVKHVVSQNCDGLHLRSGLPRTALSELHGNMYIECCYSCSPHKEYIRLFDVTERTSIHRHTTARCCHVCGSYLKDTIVHFGEKGKLASPYRWKEAVRAAKKTDLIICLGSSLKVLKKYSSLWCMDKKPKFRPKLVIVNLQWTPKDDVSTLKINGKCDSVMLKVMQLLSYKIPEYQRDHDPIFAVHTPLTLAEIKTTSKKILHVPGQVFKTKQQNKSASLDSKKSLKFNSVDISHQLESTSTLIKENLISALNSESDQSYPVIRNLLRRKNKSTAHNFNPNSGLCKMLKFCCNHQASETFPSLMNNSPPSSNALQDSVHIEDAINLYCKKKTMLNSCLLVSDLQRSEISVNITNHVCNTNIPKQFVIDLEKTTCTETVKKETNKADSQKCIKLDDNILVILPDISLHSASPDHFYLSCKNKCQENKKVYSSCKENVETCFVLNCVGKSHLKPASDSFLQLFDDKSNTHFVSNKLYELQDGFNGNLFFTSCSHSLSCCDIYQENITNREHNVTVVHNNSCAFDTKVIIDLDHCYCQKPFDTGSKKNKRQQLDKKTEQSNILNSHDLLTLQPEIFQVYKPALTNGFSLKSKASVEIEGTVPHRDVPFCGSNRLFCHSALPDANLSIKCSVFDLISVAKDSKATHLIGPVNMDSDLPITSSEKNSWCSLQQSAFTLDNIEQLESDFFISSNNLDKTSLSSSDAHNIIDIKQNKRKLTVNSLPGWYGKGLGLKKRRR